MLLNLLAPILAITLLQVTADAPTTGTPTAEPQANADAIALPTLTAEEIFARLVEANERRARQLRGYVCRRSYSVDYRGFGGHKEATMVVTAHYSAPSEKRFEITSESGSGMLRGKVLHKLLESEKEAATAEHQSRTAMTPDNYSLTLVGIHATPNGGCYRMKAVPKRKDKFLYDGEICVNGRDFAVEMIDAEPAKNPSFWTKNVKIEHRYRKHGNLWLPESNKSTTKVRLGGTAILTIEYTDYKTQAAEHVASR